MRRSERVREYRKNARKFYAVLGKAIISGYVQWQENKRYWERGYFDRMGISSGEMGDRIQGGDRTPPQDRALEIKTKDREYIKLCKKIEKAENIMQSLPEENQIILHSYCWGGTPWHEVSDAVNRSKSGFFSTIAEMEVRVGKMWEGENVDDIDMGKEGE